jgi:hypothetical protein
VVYMQTACDRYLHERYLLHDGGNKLPDMRFAPTRWTRPRISGCPCRQPSRRRAPIEMGAFSWVISTANIAARNWAQSAGLLGRGEATVAIDPLPACFGASPE